MYKYKATDFEKLVNAASPKMVAAFVNAANRLKNKADINALENAIASGDYHAIARILGIDIYAWIKLPDELDSLYKLSAALETRIQAAEFQEQAKKIEAVQEKMNAKRAASPSDPLPPYPDPFLSPPTGARPGPWGMSAGAGAGGTGGSGGGAGGYTEPGGKPFNAVKIEFNSRNPRAENYLREQSGRLIREITDDQREMIRNVLETGMRQGRNPRDLATMLIGELDKTSGKRHGGLVGLTKAQSSWVMNARSELENGDYSAFLGRELRNKTFDKTIRKAQESGKPLTQGQINKIINLYESRMLKMRAEVIARTEMLRSQNAARFEASLQALEASGTDPSFLKRQWKTATDSRVRDSHSKMHDQTVSGVDELFITPNDNGLLFPGDTQNGAPAEEVCNCRCTVINQIDYVAMARKNGWVK